MSRPPLIFRQRKMIPPPYLPSKEDKEKAQDNQDAGKEAPTLPVLEAGDLTAVGELLMFGVLAQVPRLMKAAKDGKSIRLQKGDFSAEVSSKPSSTDSGTD